jgi:hypothetical protein
MNSSGDWLICGRRRLFRGACESAHLQPGVELRFDSANEGSSLAILWNLVGADVLLLFALRTKYLTMSNNGGRE